MREDHQLYRSVAADNIQKCIPDHGQGWAFVTGGGHITLEEEDGPPAGGLEAGEAGFETGSVGGEEVLVQLPHGTLPLDEDGGLETLEGVVARGEGGRQGVEADGGDRATSISHHQVAREGKGLLLPRVDEDGPLAPHPEGQMGFFFIRLTSSRRLAGVWL